ncbi:hypothetical protein ACFL03_06525 [Thermodesulfobacteriota bacterium]
MDRGKNKTIDLITKQGDLLIQKKEIKWGHALYDIKDEWAFYKSKFLQGKAKRKVLESFIKKLEAMTKDEYWVFFECAIHYGAVFTSFTIAPDGEIKSR